MNDDLYVVFHEGEVWGTHTSEEAAQSHVDDSCNYDDRGERFSIKLYVCAGDVSVRRHGMDVG